MTEKHYRVGIIGLGMVGTPIKRYFEEHRGYTRGKDFFLFDTDPAKGFDDDIKKVEIVFISVPTPSPNQGACDLSMMDAAFDSLGGDDRVVVIKSTVPPGTTEGYQKKYPHLKVLFNPENLTEKMAWNDFVRPDAQIVGFTEHSLDAAHVVLSLLPKAPFMSPWGVGTYKRTMITATEAEIIKYARNVYFARKVNFANILANLANHMGVSYDNVRIGMAADHRIGDSHIDVMNNGYRGFGGYCFPKDLDAFIARLDASGLTADADLLRRDREFNQALLASQGLTLQDVSVHDDEWANKMSKVKS